MLECTFRVPVSGRFPATGLTDLVLWRPASGVPRWLVLAGSWASARGFELSAWGVGRDGIDAFRILLWRKK